MRPSWSPDGSRIAYWKVDPGTGRRSIWTLPAQGGEAVPLTAGENVDRGPAWSPEGRIYSPPTGAAA